MAANTADGVLLLVKKLGGVVLILVGIIGIAVGLEYRTIGFSAGIIGAGIVALTCGMALALKIIRRNTSWSTNLRQPVWRHGDLAHRAQTHGQGAQRSDGAVVDLVEREKQMMDRRQADTFAFMTAVTCFTAPVATAMLGYYNIGLSRQEIRIPAVVGAVIIAVVIATSVAIDFFCRRLRKP
jgi:hypothetical protein